jgi:hypothetical protein
MKLGIDTPASSLGKRRPVYHCLPFLAKVAGDTAWHIATYRKAATVAHRCGTGTRLGEAGHNA